MTETTKQLITQLYSPISAECAIMCLQYTTCHSFSFIENENLCKLFNYIDGGQVTDELGDALFSKDQ